MPSSAGLEPGLRAPDTRCCCCGKRKQKSIELSVVSAGPRPAPPRPAPSLHLAPGPGLEAGGWRLVLADARPQLMVALCLLFRAQPPQLGSSIHPTDLLCARYIVPNTTSPTLSPPLICSKILETSSCLIMFLHCNASKICIISPSYGWSR